MGTRREKVVEAPGVEPLKVPCDNHAMAHGFPRKGREGLKKLPVTLFPSRPLASPLLLHAPGT